MNDYESKQRQKDLQAKLDYDACKLTAQQRYILSNGKDTTYFNGNGHTKEQTTNCGLIISKTSTKQEPDAKQLRYGSNGEIEIAVDFDYGKLDSREDIVKQLIKDGGNLDALIREWVLHDSAAYQKDILRNFSLLILDSANPKKELLLILKAAGVELGEPESGEQIARRFNCTRQSISKKLQIKKKELNLPEQTRDTKKAESKATYRNRNKRNHKI